MNVIGNKYIFLGISGILVLASLVILGVWGLRYGIDFTGGSLLQVAFTQTRPDLALVRQTLEPLQLGEMNIEPVQDKEFLLRFQYIDEAKHQDVLRALSGIALTGPSALNNNQIVEKQFSTIGPVIGKEVRDRSLLSLLLAVFGIVAYITFVFRKVSHPMPSWKYGIVVILALFHDVALPAGAFAILGKYAHVEVGTLFITALLTIMGFSVHDTIVVFDRIREKLKRLKTPESYDVTVNRSIQETIARSINTSFTVLLVLLAIYFLGGETTHYFALALIIGIFFGTYSSIFVASPLLVVWHQWGIKKKQ